MAELPPPSQRSRFLRLIRARKGSHGEIHRLARFFVQKTCLAVLLWAFLVGGAGRVDASVEGVKSTPHQSGYWLFFSLFAGVALGMAVGMRFATRRGDARRQRDLAESSRAHEAQIFEIFDNLPLECWAMDRDGQYTLRNPHSRSNWQISVVEAGKQGKGPQESPALIERWQRNNQRAFSGEVVRDEFSSTRNGVARHYYSIISPMRHAGKITGIIGVNLDITDRIRTERAWHETERRLAEHIRQTPLAVIEWSIDTLVTAWNPAAEVVFGYTLGEVKGRAAVDLIIPSAERPDFIELWRTLTQEGRPSRATARNRTKSGRRISCEWWHAPVRDADGRPVGVISFAQDVTDRLALEERLQQAKQLESMGRLAAGVAQEFNNFLAPLLIEVERMGREESSPSNVREGLEQLRGSVVRAQELVGRTLAVAGKVTEEPVWASLNEIVGATMETLRGLIDPQIDLVLNIDAPLPSLQVQRLSVSKLLTQLVLNAKDTLAAKSAALEVAAWQPRLIVSTGTVVRERTIQGRLSHLHCQMLAVTDNGLGMEAEIQGRVCEPFFTTKAPGSGHGLGLAEVSRLAEGHGGWVEVESASGRGSTFWVFFPEGQTDSPFLSAPSAWVASDREGNAAVNILLVEDNLLVSHAIAALLRDAGHRVTPAADGEEAWALLESRAEPFELVVSDLNLPGMSGRELLEMMASQAMTLPVLLITGYSEAEEIQELMELGAKALLKKPVQPRELLDLISRHASKNSSV